MNGIINILKPPGMTSFDVVARMRGILKTKKIGHTGTLDPAAVGVLPVCVGNATKAIEYMTEKDKLYRAELTLGAETDTEDSTGEIISLGNTGIGEDQIREAVKSFIGKYEQIPPMYSAVRVNGKRLYELAREGITIERKPREVEIYSINVLCIDSGPLLEKDGHSVASVKVLFDVECSKGTYIRTLCADIGKRLGCGGHMSFLVRMRAGSFELSRAYTIEEIKALVDRDELDEVFTDPGKVFEHLDRVVLDEADEKRLLNGVYIPLRDDRFRTIEMLSVYDKNGRFLALGEIVRKEDGYFLKSRKLF